MRKILELKIKCYHTNLLKPLNLDSWDRVKMRKIPPRGLMLRRMKREHHEKLEAERTRRAGSLKGKFSVVVGRQSWDHHSKRR